MHAAIQHFVERMGLMLEEDGMPRIAGRMFGYLLVHEGPFSLDELAERLQVSKASISTNARLLEQLGMLERISAPVAPPPSGKKWLRCNVSVSVL